MAPLDLHEQEQLRNFKYFWSAYGKYIITGFLVIIIIYLGSVFWNWKSIKDVGNSAVSYAKFTSALEHDDNAQAIKIVSQLQLQYPKSEYSTMASMQMASISFKANELITGITMLNWVINNATDKGLVDVARLHLANIYMDQQNFDKAMLLLLTKHNLAFDSLYYVARGDLYIAKGDLNKARDAYKEALHKAGQDTGATQVIQLRLDALGNG